MKNIFKIILLIITQTTMNAQFLVKKLYQEALTPMISTAPIKGLVVHFKYQNESFESLVGAYELLQILAEEANCPFDKGSIGPYGEKALNSIENGLMHIELKNRNNFLQVKPAYSMVDLNNMKKKIDLISDEALSKIFSWDIKRPQDPEKISQALTNSTSKAPHYWDMLAHIFFKRGYLLGTDCEVGWWFIQGALPYSEFQESYIQELESGKLKEASELLKTNKELYKVFASTSYHTYMSGGISNYYFYSKQKNEELEYVFLHQKTLMKKNAGVLGNPSGYDFSVWYNKTTKQITKIEMHQ